MTSRERVLAAVERRPSDRTPADYWAVPEVTQALLDHFGFDDYELLLQRLGVDIRYVFPEYAGPPPASFPDGSRADIWGIRRDPVFNEVCHAPLASATTKADLDAFPWPDPAWYDCSGLAAACRQHAGRAVFISAERTNRPSVLHQAIYLCGIEKAMSDLALNPGFSRALFARISRFYLGLLDRVLAAAAGLADIVLIGDDFGTQEALLISPAMLRESVFPVLKEYFDLVHRRGLKVMLHSCGAIRPIIPELIAMGVDILNPIQVRAKGMVPEELKREFGSELCFHGGVDTQQTLPFGTQEEVAREVVDRVRVLGEGGGYILAPTHNFQRGTPVENMLAMYGVR